MAKEIEIDDTKIVELYMNACLLSKDNLSSVYAFCNYYEFEESEFYKYFTSFEALEMHIFKLFFTQTQSVLMNSKQYEDYDSKHKLLSFYYTFFELLTANRSFVVLKLKENKNKLEAIKKMQSLKEAFKQYVKELEIQKIDFKNDKINKLQDSSISNLAWLQLISILKFWIDDTSTKFEKTDVFIEKSVKAGFDVMNIAPVKSVFDLAKFLWKEKGVMS